MQVLRKFNLTVSISIYKQLHQLKLLQELQYLYFEYPEPLDCPAAFTISGVAKVPVAFKKKLTDKLDIAKPTYPEKLHTSILSCKA